MRDLILAGCVVLLCEIGARVKELIDELSEAKADRDFWRGVAEWKEGHEPPRRVAAPSPCRLTIFAADDARAAALLIEECR